GVVLDSASAIERERSEGTLAAPMCEGPFPASFQWSGVHAQFVSPSIQNRSSDCRIDVFDEDGPEAELVAIVGQGFGRSIRHPVVEGRHPRRGRFEWCATRILPGGIHNGRDQSLCLKSLALSGAVSQ